MHGMCSNWCYYLLKDRAVNYVIRDGTEVLMLYFTMIPSPIMISDSFLPDHVHDLLRSLAFGHTQRTY